MINVVIPAAGTGLRKNSNKPKLLTEFVDNQILLEKQINSIYEYWPNANITYVIGFNKDKIEKRIKDYGCDVIINDKYYETNVGYSIKLGLENVKSGGAFIIYGDLFFTDELIKYLPENPKASYLVKESTGDFDKKDIGIGNHNIMDYVFEDKWSQVFYVKKQEKQHFCDLVDESKNFKKFGHEIINEMISQNAKFDVVAGSGFLREMTKFKDYKIINRWLKDGYCSY